MKRKIQILVLALLQGVCCALRGEEAVDADALIAHVLERVAYLESLYDKGIEVEVEGGEIEEGKEELQDPMAIRVVYKGLYELRQLRFLSETRPSPLDEGYDGGVIVRNPKYSFAVVNNSGKSAYSVLDLYDNRDGILDDQNSSGLLDSSTGALSGLYIGGCRLRDLFDSDTFKAESVEKRGNQYRLAFSSNVLEDKCNRILGGELFFNAEDYALEELNYQGEFFSSYVPSIPWSRKNKYTYGDWDGIKYPKTKEHNSLFDNKPLHYHTTVRSFRLGPPNKKEFYLKYYGIAEPDSPKNAPSPAIFIAVGLILIGMGIYLKRRAAAGSAESK
ncbi:MAG: hypothetical protein IIZ25_05405 [Thermoguttaceae bacterium]|nr:hypothetical protein [Thermoguttaceae bacterium]